jgi:hypothetical protein
LYDVKRTVIFFIFILSAFNITGKIIYSF